MKKKVLNIGIGSIAALLFGYFVVFAATGTLVGSGKGAYLSKTYAASQVDSLYYTTKGTETALTFAAHWGDSVKITNVLLYRQFDGKTYLPLIASTDSLITVTGLTAISNDTTFVKAITLAPFPERFLIKVTYNASGNGVTSPTVKYGVIRTEGK